MSEYYNIQDSLYITESNTNVGIGITNPDKKFVVAGEIDTTNNYSVGGTQVLSGSTLGSGVINSSLTTNTGNLTNDGAFNLTTGNDFNINSTNVLNATTLGSSVISSSLKNLGTQNNTLNMGSNNITNAADIAFTSLSMGGHMIPDTDDTYDIGSAEFKIRDLYVSDNSMWVGDSHKISISGGKMKFRKRKTTSVPAAITAAGGNEVGALGNSVGINSLADMKLRHWKAYMRTLADQSGATIQDIFTDNAEDYIEDSGSYNWLESGTKTFLTSGNVGIGTQDPASLLSLHYDPESSQGLKELLRLSWHDVNYDTLKGDGTKISFHTSDTNNYPGTVEAGYFGVMKANAVEANTEADITIANNDGTNMVERIRILADGKVGVGDFSSSSPGYKLDVVGDINFTGSLYQNGEAFSSGGGGGVTGITSTTTDDALSGNNAWWPPGPSMTSNTTTLTNGIDEQDGEYVVTTSSDQGTAYGYRAFNDGVSANTGWQCVNPSYGGSNGIYSGSNNLTGDYVGEWIKIKMPTSVKITQYKLGNISSSYKKRSPIHFRLVGSNDDSTWTTINSQTLSDSNSWTSGPTSKTYNVTPSVAFQYYVLIVQKVGGMTMSTGRETCNVGFLQFYGQAMVAGGENIGINDTTPSYALDVTGDINLTGNLRINGEVQTFGGGGSSNHTGNDGFSGAVVAYNCERNGNYTTSNDNIRMAYGNGSSSAHGPVMPKDGTVIGLTFSASANSGSGQLHLMDNDSETGDYITCNSTTNMNIAEMHTFQAGDRLGMKLKVSSGTISNITGSFYVRFD